MGEVKRVHWSEVTGPVFYHCEFCADLDAAAEMYLHDSAPEDLDLDPVCYLSIPYHVYVDIEELADSLLSQVDFDGSDLRLCDLEDWAGLEAFIEDWNARQTTTYFSEDLSRQVDWTGYPWEDHCGDNESWRPIRERIAELRAVEVSDV